MPKRFTVHTVMGYLAAGEGGDRYAAPGSTAYVVDEANGAELVRYRSEDAPSWTFDRNAWALRQAREYARGSGSECLSASAVALSMHARGAVPL